ncbi:GATA zinc finger-domain-containing protein [Fusarium sp. MPI-SDFR-AT-0072]|nr:GATA zinc finger-domain-containing protein [Fusarium sp. MPI-SDFR-AT-0072]
MLSNMELIKRCLEHVKDLEQISIQNERTREQHAARPGRCHSCSRINTPEWRRGPDGARTLCNACGLHYAKLERKRQLEASSIGPKPKAAHRP